ncbi:hypothetical protein QQF64_009242 [Cirrhinus molitorella]|uniref:Uncharacterized protein n=1 Tax=Cirrhinus molitorella TaxID=172907 RepID=A0ABR3M0L4_9TELE
MQLEIQSGISPHAPAFAILSAGVWLSPGVGAVGSPLDSFHPWNSHADASSCTSCYGELGTRHYIPLGRTPVFPSYLIKPNGLSLTREDYGGPV